MLHEEKFSRSVNQADTERNTRMELPQNIHEALQKYIEVANINKRDAETPEKRQLEGVFISQFLAPLESLLNDSFKDIDGRDLRIADALSESLELHQAFDKKERSIAFISKLLEALSKFPVNDWCVSPKVALETKGINCLTASAIAFIVLDSVKELAGIQRMDYVNPYGHAATVVTLEDGSIWFADPRNNLLTDLTGHVTITESEHLRAYVADKPIAHTAYQALPALLPARYGIIENHISLAGKAITAAKGEIGEFTQRAHPTQIGRDSTILQARTVQVINGYTEEEMIVLEQSASSVNTPLISFYNESNEFKADKQRFQAQVELRHIGSEVSTNPHIREDIVRKKDSLRQFLLHETEDVGFDHPTLESAFKRYRDAQLERRTLERIDDEEYRGSVEKLLEQIH